MNKLLVLYVFHIYNDRVKHFIENCIFNDDNVDFVSSLIVVACDHLGT